MIRLDFTQFSVVAVCSCGWRTLALTRPEAWTLAAAHEQRAHEGSHQARKALSH